MNNIEEIRTAYMRAKEDRPSIVFFRTDSFYVTLFDDARLVSKILGLDMEETNCAGFTIEYLSFNEDELFNVVRNLNTLSIIPCTIVETKEFDFL